MHLRKPSRHLLEGVAQLQMRFSAFVSLILWALIVIVSLKYAILILKADNRGEGGIVALIAVLGVRGASPGTLRGALLVAGLLGAALLYGDGAITPAISVLSAVEGLKDDAPLLAPLVVPITIGILIALFLYPAPGNRASLASSLARSCWPGSWCFRFWVLRTFFTRHGY